MPSKDYYREEYSAQVNLVQSASTADIPRARKALREGAVINMRDTSHLILTPLLCCVIRHKGVKISMDGTYTRSLKRIFKYAEFLKSRGADPRYVCSEGYTFKQHANILRRKFNEPVE